MDESLEKLKADRSELIAACDRALMWMAAAKYGRAWDVLQHVLARVDGPANAPDSVADLANGAKREE